MPSTVRAIASTSELSAASPRLLIIDVRFASAGVGQQQGVLGAVVVERNDPAHHARAEMQGVVIIATEDLRRAAVNDVAPQVVGELAGL